VAVTYPGTVTPLRGLAPFTEAERDVLFGRDRERDDLARLVTGDGFRAGLLYGPPGVGKTSLLRAGLLPYLHDHGITAVLADDPLHPAESLAHAVAATGLSVNPGEAPVAFLGRMVGNALPGQQFVFVIDDVDICCADETRAAELGDLFQRVVSRSGGRARFLFVCASERVHLLGQLEKRTGSLFPPPARYELAPMAVSDASAVIDRTLALGGVVADHSLAEAIAAGLGRSGGVLPADIQIAALAVKELSLTTPSALAKLGGATELESAWLHALGRATGNERSGLRLIAELAHPDGEPRSAEWVATRISLDPAYARRAFDLLEQRGLICAVPGNLEEPAQYVLRHEILAPRVREITAPARAAARRAYELLGSKTQSKQRLTLRELRALRAEAIAPVTADERAVVDRSRRFYRALAIFIAALPIAALVAIYVAQRGQAFLDVERRGGVERVVVRAGRPALSAFFWMPASPGLGDVVADTGLSRPMVRPEAWAEIDDGAFGAELTTWDRLLPSVTDSDLAALVDYATTGNEKAIEQLARRATSADDKAELLARLRPIARGTAAEIALVDAALKEPSPAVQQAAVAVAGAAAQRRPDVYQDTLVRALASADPELRGIAFTAVRGLGGERARALFSLALGRDPDAAARRELLVELSAAPPDEGAPTPGPSVSVLSDAEAPAPMRERARGQLRRGMLADPAATTAALAPLIASEEAPADERVFAMNLVLGDGPTPPGDAVAEAVKTAVASKNEKVRAAALPLRARVDGPASVAELTPMLDDKKLARALRAATALAWGELARNKEPSAEAALERLLGDDNPDVRAAAAAAYGNLGRPAQERLIKMARTERNDVAIGAAEGLANSAEVGASASVAVDGIYQLWKKKGAQRRQAARIFARLARRKPREVVDYLAAASRSTEDDGLHPIGVDGLCTAAAAGSSEARRALARVTEDPSVEVRLQLMRCVAADPAAAKNGIGIASRLIEDPEPIIRAEAARLLAATASGGGKLPTDVGKALLQRVLDPDRSVRVIAVRALGALGPDLRDKADAVLVQAFERGDEGEKLALLRAARQIGAGGLVALGIADSSPLVRIEAVDTALATGTRTAATVGAAVADANPEVRRAALARIGESPDKLEAAAIERALALGLRDPDPGLSQLALTTLARVGDEAVVKPRLARALASRAERDRARAAAAAIGLVERRPKVVVELLTPLLSDPSHDVREALLPPLAAAWAKVSSPEELARQLRGAERDAMKRLVATAAFVTLSRSTPAGRGAAESALTMVADRGEPLTRRHARLASGLITSGADGIAFLQSLVP
jgi:hypothetical protein